MSGRSRSRRPVFEVTRSALFGLLLIVGLGVILTTLRLGAPLARLSYDLPFLFQAPITPPEVVIVAIDGATRAHFHLTGEELVPRDLQAEVLERLTRDGARVVFYDLLFGSRGADAAADERFAAAIHRHGNVVLGMGTESADNSAAGVTVTVGPASIFGEAARASALATFLPTDSDNAVRRLPASASEEKGASRVVATAAGSGAAMLLRRSDSGWLRYYGPAGSLQIVSFHQALYENGVEPGLFKDRIVCVGGRGPVGSSFLGRDEFQNPWSLRGDARFSGLEVHATVLLNILRGDWLSRPSALAEGTLAALLGVIAWVIFYTITPLRGALVVVLAGLAIFVTSLTLQIHSGIWWNWLVPAVVQFPAALIWSVTTRYASEARKRARLREAFSLYLSPQMAERVARMDFDLKPGGKTTEATVLFTDCKDFTAMSEELKAPKLISDMMIAYFTETSQHVLENDGTIIKYIADAVFACWNAPVVDPDHAAKAVRAAWGIAESSQKVVHGRVLTTRVGVCSGEVLAGNLGSPYRFDYTCMGNPVNFASRLEGLNKPLRTRVLLSDSTRSLIGDQFLTRPLGSFVVMGQTAPIAIHELLAPADAAAADLAWLPTWQAAMQAMREGDFSNMQKLMREVIWQRKGTDGPSEFYLSYVTRLHKEGRLADWTGVVRMDTK